VAIQLVFTKYEDELRPLLDCFPSLDVVLAHMFVMRLGVRVQEVSFTSDITNWTEVDCRRVGRSIATILRMVQTGEAAVDAWVSV